MDHTTYKSQGTSNGKHLKRSIAAAALIGLSGIPLAQADSNNTGATGALQTLEGVLLAGANVVGGMVQATGNFFKTALLPEPGDYNALQMAWNLISPPAADAPVNNTTDQRYAYPLVGSKGGGTLGNYDPRAYYKWQQVNLPASTGARCGDGSPYKIFVNLSPTSRNLQIFMEPGGVCFDYNQCTGNSGWSAFNPNGIPDNYTSLISGPITKLKVSTTGALESPIYQRISLATSHRFKMQDWNVVYLPYCSGDVHMGDNVKVYDSPDGKATRVQYYNGLKNVLASIGWMRDNLPRPTQLFMHGQSAGSAGSDAHKVAVRTLLNPSLRQFNMHDSGSMYPGDWTSESPDQMPSAIMYKKISKEIFNFDPANPDARSPMLLMKQALPGLFDWHDFSTVRTGYAAKWPQDRTLYIQAQEDEDFSGFMYQFNPGMLALSQAENNGQSAMAAAFLSPQGRFTTELHLKDLNRLLTQIDGMGPNTGYFSPSGRVLNGAHCLTVIDFENTLNPDTGHDVVWAIDRLIDLKSPPMLRERASDQYWGLYQPLGPITASIVKAVEPSMFMPVSLPAGTN
jgi:hypothetical protein